MGEKRHESAGVRVFACRLAHPHLPVLSPSPLALTFSLSLSTYIDHRLGLLVIFCAHGHRCLKTNASRVYLFAQVKNTLASELHVVFTHACAHTRMRMHAHTSCIDLTQKSEVYSPFQLLDKCKEL